MKQTHFTECFSMFFVSLSFTILLGRVLLSIFAGEGAGLPPPQISHKNSLNQRDARHDYEEMSDPVPSRFFDAENALSQEDNFVDSDPDQSDPVLYTFQTLNQRLLLSSFP